jgi:hypothetical protein
MVKKRIGKTGKKLLGKVSVPKGMFAYVKGGKVYGFKPRRKK